METKLKKLGLASVGLSMLILVGCSTSPTTQQPRTGDDSAYHPPQDREPVIKNLWKEESHAQISRQMIETHGKTLVSRIPLDIQNVCANYPSYDRETKIDFLVHIISVMAKYESAFNTNKSFLEPASLRDSRGNRVTSRGLLQLSIESARGYRCEVLNEQQLHNAEKNLECGVRILDWWLERDGYLLSHPSIQWRGGSRYWSVLRSTNTWNRNLLADIRSGCI